MTAKSWTEQQLKRREAYITVCRCNCGKQHWILQCSVPYSGFGTGCIFGEQSLADTLRLAAPQIQYHIDRANWEMALEQLAREKAERRLERQQRATQKHNEKA